MRRFLDGLCVVAALAIVGASALATDSAWAAVHKPGAATLDSAPSVACLGGVLNERDASDYLTAADYPAFAALTVVLRRLFICGDSIPSFLPPSQRAGFMSRRH